MKIAGPREMSLFARVRDCVKKRKRKHSLGSDVTRRRWAFSIISKNNIVISLDFSLHYSNYVNFSTSVRTYIQRRYRERDNLWLAFLIFEACEARIGVSIYKYDHRLTGTINLKDRPFARNAKMIYAPVRCEYRVLESLVCSFAKARFWQPMARHTSISRVNHRGTEIKR